jgi:hypothetical protein
MRQQPLFGWKGFFSLYASFCKMLVTAGFCHHVLPWDVYSKESCNIQHAQRSNGAGKGGLTHLILLSQWQVGNDKHKCVLIMCSVRIAGHPSACAPAP